MSKILEFKKAPAYNKAGGLQYVTSVNDGPQVTISIDAEEALATVVAAAIENLEVEIPLKYDVFELSGQLELQRIDEISGAYTDADAAVQFVMDLEKGDPHAIACARKLLGEDS